MNAYEGQAEVTQVNAVDTMRYEHTKTGDHQQQKMLS